MQPTTKTGNRSMVHRLRWNEKEIVLVGTAHVSRASAELVKQVIEEERPDTVSVELCPSRFQSIRQRDRWREMDIIRVIREKKAPLLLSNLVLAAFQKRIAEKFGVTPGQEMLQAVASAEESGAEVHLADRDIRVTLLRTWRAMGMWSKVKLIFQMIFSLFGAAEISEEEVERLKEQDVLESLISEVGKSLPSVKETLISERDRYLAEKIRTAPGPKIVAVVGAGHVPGILAHWHTEVDLAALETIPPGGRLGAALKYVIPAAILALLVTGFFQGGTRTGTDMLLWWVAANGIMAGIGALLALAHPLTILSSVAAAPLTSLNPMIAAGWVSGLVEAVSRKPRVRDFENLPRDIATLRGFWRNKVTRILLVVVFTNLGSSLGTFVAIPLMVQVM